MNLSPSGNVIIKSRRSRLFGFARRVLSVVRRVPLLCYLWRFAWNLEFDSLLKDRGKS